MNETIKLGLILFIITAVAASVLAISNSVTSERIAEVEQLASERAMTEVLEIAKKFEPLAANRLSEIVGNNTGILEISEGYNDSELVGYVFKMQVNGYGGPLTFMTGISKEGKIIGIKVLEHGETPGLGANSTRPYFANSFKGKSVDKEIIAVKNPQADNEVQALTSATVTTNAIVNGVNVIRQVYNDSLSN
ncbi:RnfABCDGE type electron transport complex subunit G [Tepidimicrobium xylanilyticum]|uniref:Ion-translocating oxidoreductase complex subunit G n=1 Tax=Tepidimicrobium xylanilyticum TaxID=1123352 RepID=A0A1H3BX06_9FIRM|nr:RnfABCDGE type electron transport complex subunit G [Tepidimicrobium xylanilyticum]GMG97268.1 electron transport complex subunit G [Tepidimicrobium xylanilyticum]SDX45904.1 electron transport complex protein RnfG [Tepidimicrobium xylanilyticum]